MPSRFCYLLPDGGDVPSRNLKELEMNSQNIVNAWEFGDGVIVQIPQENGTFTTFSGMVIGTNEDGQVEVSPSSGGKGTVLCQPSWLYSEGWLDG